MTQTLHHTETLNGERFDFPGGRRYDRKVITPSRTREEGEEGDDPRLGVSEVVRL